MAYDTLIFPAGVNPTPGTSQEVEPRVLVNSFGGGYKQRQPDGINALGSNMTIQLEGLTYAEKEAVFNFFEARKGVIPFLWTRPGETTATQWVCTKWSNTYRSSNHCNVILTFEEDFTP